MESLNSQDNQPADYDESIIIHNLSLTFEERADQLQRAYNLLSSLKKAFDETQPRLGKTHPQSHRSEY